MTSPLLMLWLGLVSVSLLALAILVGFLAVDLRRTLRGIQAMIPVWTAVARDAHRVISTANHLVTRADHSAAHVAHVVHEACDAASETLHGVRRLTRHLGTNGARNGPRGRT